MTGRFDAIVVLGHRVSADGRPGQELALRLERGLHLLREEASPVLLLSGGRDPGEPVSAAEAMYRVAIEEGVAPDRLLAAPEPRSTLQEALASRLGFAGPRRWRGLIVVTSAYHVPRARRTFDLVYGPGFRLAFEGVFGRFGDAASLARHEHEALSLLERRAAGVTPGDVAAIMRQVEA